jgi:hypothetical protein
LADRICIESHHEHNAQLSTVCGVNVFVYLNPMDFRRSDLGGFVFAFFVCFILLNVIIPELCEEVLNLLIEFFLLTVLRLLLHRQNGGDLHVFVLTRRAQEVNNQPIWDVAIGS